MLEVLVVTTKHHSEIKGYINHHFKGKLKIELVNVHDDNLDSADVLIKIADRIKVYIKFHSI
jgi:hypothetical protein